MSTGNGRKISSSSNSKSTIALGKTIQRLRKAYNMSLGELSEQSGVAKSIISQIERNETNPTIGTVEKLSKALDITLQQVLGSDVSGSSGFLEVQNRAAVPILESEDGLCRLAIPGALNLVEYIQWYDFHAKPGGVLESEPHPPGTIEHLYILFGEVEVTCGDTVKTAKTGEILRYCGDRPHRLHNCGETDVHATMVLVLRQPK